MNSISKDALRVTVLLAIATAVASVYWVLVQPDRLAKLSRMLNFDTLFVGDIGLYLIRLILIVLLFAIIPIVCVRAWGLSLADIGVCLPSANTWRSPLVIGLIIACIVGGAIGAKNTQLAQFYPFSRSLARLVADRSVVFAPLHILLYAVGYYMPWELFFRGFLLLTLMRIVFPNHIQSEGNQSAVVALLITVQTIPSTMLHFGHPPVELFAAIPFGLIAGYITYRSRSLLPVYIAHVIAGVTQDMAIIVGNYL